MYLTLLWMTRTQSQSLASSLYPTEISTYDDDDYDDACDVFLKKNEFLTAGETAETKCAEVRFCSKCYLWLELFFVCRELLPLFCFIWLIARVNCLTGYNFLNWYLTLYVRCILSWGRALGPLGGLSTGQLNCCLPRLEEKREKSTSELSEIR